MVSKRVRAEKLASAAQLCTERWRTQMDGATHTWAGWKELEWAMKELEKAVWEYRHPTEEKIGP